MYTVQGFHAGFSFIPKEMPSLDLRLKIGLTVLFYKTTLAEAEFGRRTPLMKYYTS